MEGGLEFADIYVRGAIETIGNFKISISEVFVPQNG